MNDDRYEQGLELRRQVLGAEYVDESLARANATTEPLQRLVTEWCWGTVWAREGLDRRTRSLITLAMLTALGRKDEIRLHLHGAVNNGCTLEEIREVLLHAAVYCGVPAAVDAFRVLGQEFDESDPNERPAG